MMHKWLKSNKKQRKKAGKNSVEVEEGKENYKKGNCRNGKRIVSVVLTGRSERYSGHGWEGGDGEIR